VIKKKQNEKLSRQMDKMMSKAREAEKKESGVISEADKDEENSEPSTKKKK
jgi:hypothetical protein